MITVTLPILGVRNIPVGSAPFQFPFSRANLGFPYFLNGSAQTPGRAQSSGSGGYLGLKYAYGNVPMSIGATTGAAFANNGGMPMMQFAGGIVQSFGVYDYLSLFPNPWTWEPTLTNKYNGGSYTTAFTPGAMWYSPNTIPLVSPQLSYIASIPFPDILFGNVSEAPIVASAWLNSPHGGGVTIKSAGILAYMDPISRQWGTAYNVVNSGSSLLCNGYVFCGPGAASNIPFIPVTGGLGIFAGMNSPDATAGCAMAVMSPRYNRWLLAFETFGGAPALAFQNAFTGNTQPSPNPNPTVERIAVNLAVASDQALIAGGSFSTSVKGTVDPAGNFLMTPFTNATAGGLTWLYIMGDGSGYYRINFVPQGPAAATINSAITNANTALSTSGGFGIDVNGNFWIIQPNTQNAALYSSLDLAQQLAFPPFPQVSNGYVGCRSNPCEYPWYG